MLIQVYWLSHLINPSNQILLKAKKLQQCFSFWCQMSTSFFNFVNAKKLCLLCLMRQKLCWNYFAFNQSYLTKGKIALVVICFMKQIRTGSDWWVSKMCGSGLGRIQFYRIRSGLGLKNFTVRSSLDFTQSLLLLKRYRLQKSANFIETNLLRYLSISCKLYKNQPA